MRRSARTIASWGFVFIACGIAIAEAPPLEVYSFDEPRPLTVDESRIAIRVVGIDGRSILTLDGAVGAALAVAGVDTARAERSPVAGWWLAPIEEATRGGRSTLDVSADAVVATARIADRASGRVEFISPVFFDDLGGPMYATPQLLVRFAPGTTPERAEAILAETGAGTVIEQGWTGDARSYRIAAPSRNGTDALNAARTLALRGDVEYAEPDMVFTGRGDFVPNDPGFGLCWGLNNTGQFGGSVVDRDMNAPQAWDTTLGSSSIITVIIDTGVQQNHPDINQIAGFDTTTDAGDGGPVNSFDNHGTAVGGCVSAIANNGLGTVGIAPGTRVLSARTFIATNSSGNWSSTASWTVSSLSIAESLGARVSNNSNYYGFTSSAISSMYSLTRTNGMVHFSSAGNDNQNVVGYPASLPTVLAIGALASSGQRASFSNYGPNLAFMAPGQTIYSTDRTGSSGYYSGDYGYVDGTSFASPYSAGVAALLLSRCADLSAAEVEDKMFASCVDLGAIGRDDTFGLGLIRADQAISSAGLTPCRFSLLAPADSATGVTPAVVFSWSDAAWADTYALEVRDDQNALVIDEPSLVATTFTAPQGALVYGRAYSWSVVAMNAEGGSGSDPTASAFTTAPSPCLGDINGDGKTNTLDFNILASTFGQTVPIGTGADLAQDGVVNSGDFNVLAFAFGCGG